MPVGAIVGSTVVGVGSAAMGASAQKKAANSARDTALETAQLNNQLARELYAQNSANFQPYFQTGNSAMSQLNALLGIGGPAVGPPGTGFQSYASPGPMPPATGGAPVALPNPSGSAAPCTSSSRYDGPVPNLLNGREEAALAGRAQGTTTTSTQPTSGGQASNLSASEINARLAFLDRHIEAGPRQQQLDAFQGTPAQKLALAESLAMDNEMGAYTNRFGSPSTSSGQPQPGVTQPSGTTQTPFIPPNYLAPPPVADPLRPGQLTAPGPTQYTPRTVTPLTTSRLETRDIALPPPAAATPLSSRVQVEDIEPYVAQQSGFLGTAMDPGSLTDFNKSTGYQFIQDEAADAINHRYAAGGALQSGAAQKELQQRSQDIAASQYYDRYIGQLDRYLSYNDEHAFRERAYGGSRADYGRDYRFRTGSYLDQFDQFERGYADTRNDIRYQADVAERAYRDNFAFRERGYQDQFAFNERGYQDQFGMQEQQCADARGDYARSWDLGLRNHNDAFSVAERNYADARGDYNRAYYSDALNNYLNRLTQQQGMGLTAASALAGVGNSYLSSTTANNNSAAAASGNAALIGGQATAGMYGSIGSAVGNALGMYALMGSGQTPGAGGVKSALAMPSFYPSFKAW